MWCCGLLGYEKERREETTRKIDYIEGLYSFSHGRAATHTHTVSPSISERTIETSDTASALPQCTASTHTTKRFPIPTQPSALTAQCPSLRHPASITPPVCAPAVAVAFPTISRRIDYPRPAFFPPFSHAVSHAVCVRHLFLPTSTHTGSHIRCFLNHQHRSNHRHCDPSPSSMPSLQCTRPALLPAPASPCNPHNTPTRTPTPTPTFTFTLALANTAPSHPATTPSPSPVTPSSSRSVLAS